MLITWLVTAAIACTGSYTSTVVGSHPTDDWVVVRVESSNEESPSIDLVWYNAVAGNEQGRFVILRSSDHNSPQVRARNWADAEASFLSWGIVFTPDLSPVPKPPSGFRGPAGVPVGGAALVFSEGSMGDGDYLQRTLQVAVQRDGATLSSRTLAHWLSTSSANGWHFVNSVWALPEGRAAVFEGISCYESRVHFLELQPAVVP